MVGVASPMLIRSPWQGLRFVLALTAGTFLAAAVVASVVSILSMALSPVGTEGQRTWAAAIVVAVLGILDVLGKTPHVHRQTPKPLYGVLRSKSLLGLVWGFDIGLLVTTIKKTSLLWAGLILAAMHGPAAVTVTVVLYSVTWLLGQYLMTSSAVVRRDGASAFYFMQRIGAAPMLFRMVGLGLLAAAGYLAMGQ